MDSLNLDFDIDDLKSVEFDLSNDNISGGSSINVTKDNTIDGKDPIETTITTPTKLVTQEPGDSKLKVE